MNTYTVTIRVKDKGVFKTSVDAESEYAARRLIESQYEDVTILAIHKD